MQNLELNIINCLLTTSLILETFMQKVFPLNIINLELQAIEC